MRFHCLRDLEQHKRFKVFWKPGTTNLGDYHTKHFHGSNHQGVHPTYLNWKNNQDIRGRTETLSSGIHHGCVKTVPGKATAISALARLLKTTPK